MKRYLVFIGDAYYPAGGMEDFAGDFITLSDCKRKIRSVFLEDYAPEFTDESPAEHIKDGGLLMWAHIYDIVERRIVWDSNKHSLYRNDLIMKGWIKAEDKLPEESGEYIVYWINDVEVIWFETDVGWLNHFEVPIQEQKEVTHWQPLPDKPNNNE